jgi:hypothetical protein
VEFLGADDQVHVRQGVEEGCVAAGGEEGGGVDTGCIFNGGDAAASERKSAWGRFAVGVGEDDKLVRGEDDAECDAGFVAL